VHKKLITTFSEKKLFNQIIKTIKNEKEHFNYHAAAAVMLVASASYASGNKAEGYTVYSVIDGRESTTAYNKKGHWLYTIQRYSTDNLDKNIIDKVRIVYDNYGVTSIQKIEQPGMDAVYVVHLENTKSIKLVRLTRDDMELVQGFNKQ